MPGVPDEDEKAVLPLDIYANKNPPARLARNPENLQGLLRFAVEASTARPEASGTTQHETPAPVLDLKPMDDENKKFLIEALNAGTVDVIAKMKESIEQLKDVQTITVQEVDSKEFYFNELLEYCDNLDIANDFYKINGFSIIEPCLQCPHEQIRANICELIAALAQNNPFIQEAICNYQSVISQLLKIIEQDQSTDVKVKALYAMSSITRGNQVAYQVFKANNGLHALNFSLGHSDVRLKTKSSFLLRSLIEMDPAIVGQLLDKDLEMIAKNLDSEYKNYHEHHLSLLLTMVDKSPQIVQRLKGLQVSGKTVKELFIQNVKFLQGKEEYTDEQESYEKLIAML